MNFRPMSILMFIQPIKVGISADNVTEFLMEKIHAQLFFQISEAF